MTRAHGTQTDTDGVVQVGIAQAGNDGHMMIRLLTGSRGEVHQLSLAQARALSLELIRQVHRIETGRRLKNPSKNNNAVFHPQR